MPELPEVETVKRGLNEIIGASRPVIRQIRSSGKKLRFALPRGFGKALQGELISQVERRAKYLVFKTSGPTFICHLGMTGSWRLKDPSDSGRDHDHISIQFEDSRELVYNDPRRFGYFDLLKSQSLTDSKWFSHLGPEPLSEEFDSHYLFESRRKKTSSVKTWIMDQKTVVGVGNIYASEALFLSGLRPTKKAGALSKKNCESLTSSIKSVLNQAIEQGGTTIRDFRSAGGSEGYFQQKLLVYGREAQDCSRCGGSIKKTVLTGRSTYWCPRCQK